MNNTSKEYFPALTGLRAVAALMVFIHHVNPFSAACFGLGLSHLAAELHIGVTVFFVLSGFLIGYRYLGGRPVPLRTYFANRFARIYPMYFLLTTLTFITFYYKNGAYNSVLLTQYLLNITFLRGFFNEYLFTGIQQGWSLTVEELFYVSAPLLFWLVRRSRHWLWLFPLLLAAAGVDLVVLGQPHPWHGFFVSFNFLFQFTYLGRAFEFCTGIALAWRLRHTGAVVAPRFITYAGLAGILLCLWGITLLHGPGINDFGVRRPFGLFLNNVVLPLLGIMPLLWGLVGEATWVRRLLSSRPLLLLGKSSYVFYLIHMGVLQHLLHRQLLGNVGLVLLYPIAILLYWLVEEPLNHWLRRVLASKNSRYSPADEKPAFSG